MGGWVGLGWDDGEYLEEVGERESTLWESRQDIYIMDGLEGDKTKW